MNSVETTLDTLVTDFEDSLPALLVAAGINDFTEYVKGPSRQHNQQSLCFYIDEGSPDIEEDSISIIIQAQLYGIDYDDSLKYLDVVKDFIFDYDPENIGYIIRRSFTYEHLPIEQKKTTFIFFNIEYTETLDSCDQ